MTRTNSKHDAQFGAVLVELGLSGEGGSELQVLREPGSQHLVPGTQ